MATPPMDTLKVKYLASVDREFHALCFPKRNLVYHTFILMRSGVEFNSEQNGNIAELKSENIRLRRTKKE